MISFDRFKLENGLRFIVHKDASTPIGAFNVLYDVGAKHENENRTGFAHLFEHLMFGGSVNIPDFDKPLQQVGGDSNAFTSNDITNYYETMPIQNIETAFWLESDRLLSLDFSERSLDVQRNVVIEEFKQRYLNQPYGDVWLLLRPMVFKQHPYKWPTIGKEISHIEDATLNDVKEFFYKHYIPRNAIVCVAGDIDTNQVKELAEKWFGPIEDRFQDERLIVDEPNQEEPRFLEVERNVPFNAIYKVYRAPKRRDVKHYEVDLISDILSRGKSSRLYIQLVKEQKLFSEISAYVSGDLEEGMLIISGNLIEGVSMDVADKAIEDTISELVEKGVEQRELDKVKNKVESSKVFTEMSILDKAMSLCYFELLGDANMINSEMDSYQQITPSAIQQTAKVILKPENCSTLHYKSKQV